MLRINLIVKIQSILILSIFIMQFSALSAAEKTVKVRERQSSTQLVSQSSLESDKKALNDSQQSAIASDSKSEILEQHRSYYKDVSDPSLSVPTPLAIPQTKQRNTNKQSLSHDFFFDSVYVYMDTDLDGDGYYSEFTVNFDADTNFNVATVYARLYLSLNGGPWELYYTTRNFNLEGYSAYDDFSVSTILTSGYPPGNYDILIDLYDQYDDSLVATISADDNFELSNNYLEDVSYETSVGGDPRFSLFSASITLITDNDRDGYYQSFSLQFDADIDSGSSSIYAEVWMKDNNNHWSLEHTTEDFLIEGFSTIDTYILESVLESGYKTGLYDFRVDVYDAYSGNFLTSSDNLAYELSDVPLEDSLADAGQNSSGGSLTVISSSDSVGSGGAGSTGGTMILLMLFAYLTNLYKKAYFNKL